ncbi:MAG: pilus assembly protein TadG-related protein [Armatimonadota bacterium]
MSGRSLRRRFVSCWRAPIGRSGRASRRGSVYALSVVALPVIIGAAALAIDLGMMTNAAQRVRHVADSAALAGAACYRDERGAEAIVRDIVNTNNEGSPWQVTPEARFWGPGQYVPGYGTLGPRECAADVVGHTQFRFAFARVLGLDTADIARRAVARATLRRNDLSGGCIFAGATEPGVYGVGIDGAGVTINSSIHSNTGVYFSGPNMTVTGDITYRNAYDQGGQYFTLGGAATEGSVQQYPLDFTWDEFDQGPWDHEVASLLVSGTGASIPPGRWRVRGDMTINATNTTCHDALFVADGNILVNGSGALLDRVTLVARGTIHVNGTGGRFSPFVHDLFAFTTADTRPDRSDWAMLVEAADCVTYGILFAPNGRLIFDGSEEITYHVGLVAETIRLIGTGCTHDGPPCSTDGQYYSDVRLVL